MNTGNGWFSGHTWCKCNIRNSIESKKKNAEKEGVFVCWKKSRKNTRRTLAISHRHLSRALWHATGVGSGVGSDVCVLEVDRQMSTSEEEEEEQPPAGPISPPAPPAGFGEEIYLKNKTKQNNTVLLDTPECALFCFKSINTHTHIWIYNLLFILYTYADLNIFYYFILHTYTYLNALIYNTISTKKNMPPPRVFLQQAFPHSPGCPG